MKYIITLFIVFSFAQLNAQSVYSLPQALKSAKENNPYLKANVLNIDLAKADVITAGLRPNPVINSQSLQLLNHLNQNVGTFNKKNQQLWWQLTRTFQIQGQRENKIAVAKQTVELVDKNYQEIQRNLYYNTANKWIEVWISQKKLKLIKTAISNVDTLLNINTYRYQKQVISETELFRTQLLAKQYVIQQNNIQREHNQLINELKLLIGTNENIRITDNDDDIYTGFSDSLENLLAISLENRTDLQALKTSQKVADTNIKLQKSLAYPQPQLGFIYNPQNSIPYFGLYANIDLPFFSRNQGEIQKAKIQREQVNTQIEAVRKSIETETLNDKRLFEISKQNVADYQKITQQSEHILANVKYAYAKGGTTIIDFLEAQRSWLDAQQQYYETLLQYRQSQVQLLNTLGLINILAQ